MNLTNNNNDPKLPNSDIQDLLRFSAELNKSSESVKKSLKTLKGRSVTALLKKVDKMPKWAIHHVTMHQQFVKKIYELEAKGNKIPDEALQALKQSKKALDSLVFKVSYPAFLKAFLPTQETIYTDSSKLLTPLKPDSSSHANTREWELNYSLLYAAYEHADELMREIILFLMINYLSKAAFLNEGPKADLSEQKMAHYRELLQIGQLTMGGMYHRTAHEQSPMLKFLRVEEKIGALDETYQDLIALDMMEVQDLYKISFAPSTLEHPQAIVDLLVSQFESCLDQFPAENMPFPVLIDVTDQIDQSLITDKDPEKIKNYEDKQKLVKEQINGIIKHAAAIIKKKHPDRNDIQAKLEDYLKVNTAVVSRAKVNDHLAVLGLHRHLFTDEDFNEAQDETGYRTVIKRHSFLSKKINEWAGLSAASLGAVNFRRAIASTHQDPSELLMLGRARGAKYAGLGKTDIIMYSKPEDITKATHFKKLRSIADDEVPNVGEAQKLLAQATVKMIETLINQIEDKGWQKENRVERELIQTAIFRAMQHLAIAENHLHDFRKFSQAIDRTHAELTTLLALYTPFDPASFDSKYKEFLRSIFPPSLNPVVGLAKSAMNVFSGVNAAVLNNNPKPVRVCGAHSYYEEANLVGGNRNLDDVIKDPKIDKVDLYVAEFYHNIDINPQHTTYQKGTVIQDIKKIFAAKPNTDQLTVAIDATIDFVQSADMAELLQEFEKEINEGKLNIVVFRSGQKFDMLGLDHYYGSPFYIVNNGDKKWAEFNKLKTEKAYRTDLLSEQYFTWMVESGPETVDEYKKLIFDNTRDILNMVPAELKPESDSDVCVCIFEPGVKTPLIDIKIDLPDWEKNDALRQWAQTRFIELFTLENKLAYVRGSFGFAHPNITWIEPKLRINPGIDPDDNRIYQIFFNELKDKVHKTRAQSLK